jgi:holo-[acyl-carrier protein] synthase
VRVGIDLVSVEDVRHSIATLGDRYLERIYTAAELDDCGGEHPDPERLAARFAAKEAALKVLRPGDHGLALTTIEVRRAPEGWVELGLSGPAAELAAEAGLSGFALSIAHEAGFATAVVTAETA